MTAQPTPNDEEMIRKAGGGRSVDDTLKMADDGLEELERLVRAMFPTPALAFAVLSRLLIKILRDTGRTDDEVIAAICKAIAGAIGHGL